MKRWICLALIVAGLLTPVRKAAAQDTVKIGILHSLSGTMAISETSLRDAVLMAVEEINAKGGVMGKKIEPVVVDPASNWPLFAEKAKELIVQDKVAVTFGCWTSVSRKSALPVFVCVETEPSSTLPAKPCSGSKSAFSLTPGARSRISAVNRPR